MDSPYPTRILLVQAVLQTLAKHSETAYPAEACGVLIGCRSIESLTIEGALPGQNLADDPQAFELDPGSIVAAELEAANTGRAILGFWHSHPDRAAVLSESDRIGAWPHALQLVIRVTAEGMGFPRLYRGLDANWSEVGEVEIVAP